MSVVADTEKVAELAGRWNPADVAFLRRARFENFDGAYFDLALLLLLQPRPPLSAGWPDPKGKFWEVDMLFNRVTDLVLTVVGPWDIQTPGFELEDISDRQWENVNLLVSDYEGLTTEGIRFGAKSAQVRSCRVAAHPPNSQRISRQYPGIFGAQSDSVG